MRLRFPLVSLITLVFASLAPAQSVHWDPPGGTLPVGQTRALGLVFEGCSPKGDPKLPRVNNLTLQFYGQNSSTSVVNLTVTQSVTLTYAVALTRNERTEIPSFEVETDKGRMRVPAARFDPTGATVGSSGTPLESAASAKLTATPTSVWAGEVFDLVTIAEATRTYLPQFQRAFEWNADPLLAESWTAPEQVDFTSGGEPHVGITFRARAIARTAGTLKLNPATHIISLSVGVSGFGFFQQRQFDQFSVASNTPTIEVKPLPPQSAGFSGAVGQFKLTSKVVPATAAIGEPVTWTLELSGTGNWPDIAGLPSRDVSKDFNVVQPQAKRTPAEGKIFDVTLAEDVVLVPTKAGTYTLGPVSFVYFDPKAGAYKTVSAPRTTVTVTAPDMSKFKLTPPSGEEAAAPETGSGTKSGASAVTLSSTPPPVATLPSGIPRDPLPGAKVAATPRTVREMAVACLVPFGALLVVWAGLALRLAQRTDPILPRRQAHERLAATVAKLKTAGAAQRPALLLDWQRDTARLWEIPHAAPSAAAFTVGGVPSPGISDPRGEGTPPTTGPRPSQPAWSQLWADADRTLYSAEAALPPDWTTRAEAALATKRVPGFSPLRLFRLRNLAPFFFVVALAATFSPAPLRAQDAAASYRAGDFPAAEKAWRDLLVKTPTDAIAHHNLSLALAQQDRWSEAAAQAAVAFVQNPAEPAVQWQFALAAEKAGAVPGPLAAFLRAGPARELAGRASPSDWQRYLVIAACGVALALAGILFNAYGRRSRGFFWSAFVAFGLFSALALVSVYGVASYGAAADTRAVITWRSGTLLSIPTEADTSQKTTPLTAGTLAIADKTYLGWTHLAFENGQTGWVRKEELVPVWK